VKPCGACAKIGSLKLRRVLPIVFVSQTTKRIDVGAAAGDFPRLTADVGSFDAVILTC
jgi:hypothetical protein